MKNSFSLTITEKDLQTAKEFSSCHSCLLATALKRRGLMTNPLVGIHDVWDDKYVFTMTPSFSSKGNVIKGASQAPFYVESVVGRKFTFTKSGRRY